MREKIRDKGRLEHMLEAIDIILERTSGMTEEIKRHNLFHKRL